MTVQTCLHSRRIMFLKDRQSKLDGEVISDGLMDIELQMYNLPQVQPFISTWQQSIIHHATALDPNMAPSLNLSQTCGLPLSSYDRNRFRVVATPAYSAEGCSGPDYRSAIIVHSDSSLAEVADLRGKRVAVNSQDSCSGCLLLVHRLGAELYDTCMEELTGGHVATMAAVREGRADFGAVDCVTLALVRKHDAKLFKGLKILEWTDDCPALPYVTSGDSTDAQLKLLQDALRLALADPTERVAEARSQLLINSFSFQLDQDDYISRIQELFDGTLLNLDPIPVPKGIHLGGLANESMEQIREYHRTETLNDVALLKEGLELIRKNLKGKTGKTIHYVPLEDGRNMRMVVPGDIFPDLENIEEAFNLVGFFGLRPQLQRRLENDLKISSLCHDVDDDLSKNIDPTIVLLYMSMERKPGGSGYNMVLFAKGQSAEGWGAKAGPSHVTAVQEVSPYFYSEVRIHRASVASLTDLNVSQTLTRGFFRGSTTYRHVFKNILDPVTMAA